MQAPVLLAYATRGGSTKEVIRAVADVLRDKGITVALKRAAEVDEIRGYGLVVLGAPLYMGRLLRDARKFIERHRAALSTVPTAMFAVGPIHDEEKEFTGARQQLANQLKKYPWFKPVVTHVVGGKLDPATLGFPFKWVPAMKKIPMSDARNWTEIRRYASELTANL